MAITFIQDSVNLTVEQWDLLFKNSGEEEVEIEGLCVFSFESEGEPEWCGDERKYGMMVYVLRETNND